MRFIRLIFFIHGFLCMLPTVCHAQTTMKRFRSYLEKNINEIQNKELPELYERIQYSSVWLKETTAFSVSAFEQLLQDCPGLGLDKADYVQPGQTGLLQEMRNLKNIEDSVQFEVKMSAALIDLTKDLFYGNHRPAFGYYGISYDPGCYDIISHITEAMQANDLLLLVRRSMALSPEILPLCEKLRTVALMLSSKNFQDIKVLSKEVTPKNTALIERLYQLGFLPAPSKPIKDTMVRSALKEAQAQFDLINDGVLRSTSLLALNVPLEIRKKELETAINNYRWLSCMKNGSVAVVNIPEAYLRVWQNSTLTVQMKLVVGKPSTPTPALASTIDQVILYPYWHVPYSIATRELLPAIKRNIAVLEKGNYRVLDNTGRIVSPSAVNWKRLGPDNFPYTIRQSTGCDNSLGLLKLNFYSPFGVYLHDTPLTSFFMLKKRFLSHGCMRMEKPFELGHLLMKNDPISIDTLEQAGCLRNQSPVELKAKEKIPVLVWYNPVGLDSKGRPVFFEDIYAKFTNTIIIKK